MLYRTRQGRAVSGGSMQGSGRMSYDQLNQHELAKLVPELLLSGHMIDRSGMGHVLAAFGQKAMTQVAIEEWMGASPVYTRRMRAAFGLTGDTVAEIFKMMQQIGRASCRERV